MANRADFAKRFGSLFLASIFLITSVAFTAVIIWQSRDDNAGDAQANLQEQLNQQLEDQKQSEQPLTGENMLQGTALASFTPSTEPVTQLQSIDLVEGTGEVVNSGATVTAHYTGAYVVNGEIFQSSKDTGQPIPFSLNEVIVGWTEGVPGMKVGGTRRLIIPAEKAYGVAPEGYTPGSTERPLGPLVFDIELVEVQQ